MDGAIADFTEAIKLDPKSSKYWNARGVAYRVKRDYEHAVADFSEVMRLEPNGAAGVYNRGFSYRLMGRRDQAIADLTEAIRLDPKDADAFEERALAYYGQSDPDHGLADYAEAIKLNPTEPRLHNGRCYARVTTGRELPEAVADCTEALRLGPKYGLALQNRGHAYLRTGQFDLALADFEARLALGNSAYALYGRGVAKLKKDDSSGSVDIAVAKGLQSDVAAYYSRRGVPAP